MTLTTTGGRPPHVDTVTPGARDGGQVDTALLGPQTALTMSIKAVFGRSDLVLIA